MMKFLLCTVMTLVSVCAENNHSEPFPTTRTQTPLVSKNMFSTETDVKQMNEIVALTSEMTLDSQNSTKSQKTTNSALTTASPTVEGTSAEYLTVSSTPKREKISQYLTKHLEDSLNSSRDSADISVNNSAEANISQHADLSSTTTHYAGGESSRQGVTNTEPEDADVTSSPEELFRLLDSIHVQTSTTRGYIAGEKTFTQQTTGESSPVSSTATPQWSSTGTVLRQTKERASTLTITTEKFKNAEEFIKWLDSIYPDGEANRTNLKVDSLNFDPDIIPPQKFIEWLNSIHPDKNRTTGNVVPAKNVVDTSIITTEKLIIVISTICGTFVLFVVILIIVTCCRRKQNVRSDSEKSDFSVTSGMSAVSFGSSVSTIPDKQEVNHSKRNGYTNNDLFQGIPPNNKIWKELEHLPSTASSVMPECTRM